MLTESKYKEESLEDEFERVVDQIKKQNQDKLINVFVKRGRTVIEKLQHFEEKDATRFTRFIKHWPSLVDYELSIYKRYLAQFCTNNSKSWKIGEMWSYEIDSK